MKICNVLKSNQSAISKFSFNLLKSCIFALSVTRRSHRRCSVKKDVLKSTAKITENHLLQSFFFNKVAGFRPATLLKKRLWHMCFPVNFMKFLRTPFLYRTPLAPAPVPSKAVFVESEADTVDVQYKMVFLKISQKSTCVGVFFNKVAGLLLV